MCGRQPRGCALLFLLGNICRMLREDTDRHLVGRYLCCVIGVFFEGRPKIWWNGHPIGVAMRCAGGTFTDASGARAAQGMLSWRLRDQLAGRELIAATFHLKAKAGAVNDSMRQHQV